MVCIHQRLMQLERNDISRLDPGDAKIEEQHIKPGSRGCQDRGTTSSGDVKIVDPHNHGSSESALVEDRCEGRGQICILYVRKVIVTFTSSQARLRSMVKDLYIPMES